MTTTTTLPALTGSAKQVAWAEQLRGEYLAGLAEARADDEQRLRWRGVSAEVLTRQLARFERGMALAPRVTDAGWWLDRSSSRDVVLAALDFFSSED